MSTLYALSAILLLATFASVQGIKCNEGFNVSLSGIPFYHWAERTCDANSKCFGQELGTTITGMMVKLRYGACISSSYADLLDCDKLFGPSSTIDPAQLLNLIPGIEGRINATVHDFIGNEVEQLKKLFSDGEGLDTFISGVITFYENMGFNMEKVKPLQPSLTKLFESLFNMSNPTAMGQAVGEFFTALGQLDTENTEFTADIYKFLGNFLNSTMIDTLVKGNQMFDTLIKKVPGLLQTMWPQNWNSTLWYDIVFKLVGDIDITQPKKSAEDAIATIRAHYTIPAEVKVVLDPLFDAIPDLVEKLAMGNFNYTGTWSLELLKKYSETNTATEAFSAALINFVEKIANVTTLETEYKTMIQWMPGLFYKFFPAEKAQIEDVYNKMAAGFNSFNFANLSDTAAPTKLSDFVLDMMKKITTKEPEVFEKALVINFSRMFYNLLSDYNTELDKFFQIIIDGFVNFPNIDAGAIISNMITGMGGGEVPPEVKPLLDNMQGLINAATQMPFNATVFFNAMDTIVNAYKTQFPSSPMPDLVQQYYMLIKEQTEWGMYFSTRLNQLYSDWANFNQTAVNELMQQNQVKSTDFTLRLVYWQIDLQFAMFELTNIPSNELTNAVVAAFPQYATYIRLMEALKPDDIKQLVKDIAAWIATAQTSPLTSQGFVDATKPTFEKITASISNVTSELRYIFAPDSCSFGACDSDLCNTHAYIDAQEKVTKVSTTTTVPMTTTPAATESTTSGSVKVSYSFLLHIALMWMACKSIFG